MGNVAALRRSETAAARRPARSRLVPLLLGTALALLSSGVAAKTLTVAVASNFATAMDELADRFRADSGIEVRVSRGSTGKLYAQIVNGAPFDVFLAADVERPERLEHHGLTVPGSRFTYAIGRLVLWSRDPALSADSCRAALAASAAGRIAIANPDTAPYGAAARDVLIALGLWEQVASRLVTGENIGQTLQFVASGNASLGFIANAQLEAADLPRASCIWQVPEELHAPLEQQAVLLARATDNDAARRFLAFLNSDTGRAIVAANGYALPHGA